MEKEKQNRQTKSPKYGYTTISDYFLIEWVKVVGMGPTVLYMELLSYCHKGKDIAWPTLDTLCKRMGIAKTTVIRYQNILIKFNLIKNITRGKSSKHHHKNNIYQIIPPQNVSFPDCPESKNNEFYSSKLKPLRYQNDTCNGSKMKPSMVANCYPNNNNLNNNNITTTKRENAVVDFKKLKEKGEERVEVIKEHLVSLDFKESFIEKLIKDFPLNKIEEKLELLLAKINIQNPAGWLYTALKNEYQHPEQEKYDEEPAGQASRLSSENKEILSRKEALKKIRIIRGTLSLPVSSRYPGGKEPG